MAIPSYSVPQAAASSHQPPVPAFSALCDEALRRCSTQHSLPVTPSEEMRLWAWQLCWLALDAASAPANQLPDIADTQGWPPELVEQLRAAPGLPKLNTRTWQELRRAREQQLFATLPPQAAAAPEALANEALAAMLTESFARLGVDQLRAWVTPSVTAAMARWLSAALLAVDALALSDDNTEATALGLVVFVQDTLQREHGAAAPSVDLVQSEPALTAAVSGRRAPEASRAHEPAAEPAPAAVAAQAELSDGSAGPSTSEASGALAQPPSTSIQDAPRVGVPAAFTRAHGPRPRPTALIASAVAVAAAALLLLMFRSNRAPSTQEQPPVSTPAPSAHVVTPKPLAVEPPPEAPVAPVTEAKATPQPSSKQLTPTAPQRPRFRSLTAAKRAHSAKKIDDAAYAAAIAELEAVRTAKISKEQLDLQRGKLSQADYQRRVDAINRNLGFDRR